MKLNDIKFLPNANAFSDVYDKATGMPFVGEMMVAAAGQESEPTPDPEPDPEPTPTEFAITNITFQYDEETGDWSLTADANMDATGYSIFVIADYDAFDCRMVADEEDPTKLVVGDDYDTGIDPSVACNGCEWSGTAEKDGETTNLSGTYTYIFNPDCGNCDNWELCGYESYEDCDCQVNGNCPPDCDNWEDMGYGSYWECECNENDHCVDCDNWEDEGFESYEDCDCEVNNHNCIDCENVWETEGYSSYEDCECQANGNCGGDRIELSDIVVNQQEDGYTIGGGINGETANEMYLVFDAEEIPIGVDYDHSSDPYWVFIGTYEGSSIEFEDGGICTLKVIDPEISAVIQEDDYTYSYIPMDNEPL